MPVDLEALTDQLFETADALLGDSIIYTPEGGSPLEIKTAFSGGTVKRDFGLSAAVSGDAALEISKALVPVAGGGDIIADPLTGERYQPREIQTDDSRRYWLILLKRMPD